MPSLLGCRYLGGKSARLVVSGYLRVLGREDWILGWIKAREV